ncbi:PA0069 family radical SAM protein [Leeuwenhoekiella marinoflava]|uniref:DNA repair photolyase n=2 Tax=Leeuwenhoekiella marinoflava TaxID=988 RepID=A0A4Q0PB18_9FLAO|nr:PA0069 family radical SAM protein [Leeuwenhoekiella marinoflava]RXG23099.1 DNA repair photolyase [Leeuwenhoekiella marinoflava]SHE30534.1 DNA repair photolyase [Leeuwenhoekiella marinoflava DSM 3653]
MRTERKHLKGRGAQAQIANRFDQISHELRDDFLNYCAQEGDEPQNLKTLYIDTFPKSIVNKVDSPDVGMEYSLNPYQGCEHGCVYCYARNSHEYWGYGAGLDFESRILVKRNAVRLLEKQLTKKSWKATPIVLSGNTDCYQPAEKQFKITRSLLEAFYKYRHPVAIITKNALIQRDFDIIKELAANNLIQVNMSITTLDEKTRRLLEPRTASIKKRLETLKKLAELGVPVNVMTAPIIPGINSHEVLPLIKAAADHGAHSVGYTVVRLNGAIGKIFEQWIKTAMPDRADKVLNQIAACHEGTLNDSQFGRRMRGSGEFANQIKAQMELGRKKFLKGKNIAPLNCDLFEQYRPGQLSLF